MSKPRKLETQRWCFRVCRCNFKVNKFGNSSLLGKSGFISSETFSKRRKERILKEQFLLIFSEWLEWKLFKTCSYFRIVCAIFVLEKLGT